MLVMVDVMVVEHKNEQLLSVGLRNYSLSISISLSLYLTACWEGTKCLLLVLGLIIDCGLEKEARNDDRGAQNGYLNIFRNS